MKSGLGCACAAGTICNGNADWNWIKIGLNGNPYVIDDTGYTLKELLIVERLFMAETIRGETRDTQFDGLCKVVEYLCLLDELPDVMEYKSLFEVTTRGSPVRELEEVFI